MKEEHKTASASEDIKSERQNERASVSRLCNTLLISQIKPQDMDGISNELHKTD